MNGLQRSFFSLVCLSFISLPAQAWDISVQRGENQPPMVWVGNQQPQALVDVYLLWLDMDTDAQHWFQSWHVERGWQLGIHRVFDQAIEMSAFERVAITPLALQCPEKHRCFLGALAVEPGNEALDLAHWKDAAVLPLNVQAAYERLPAQTLFLNADEGNGGVTTTTADGVMNVTGTTIPSSAPAAPTEDKAAGTQTTTEKPDIFRLLDNNRLLYVNAQAERMQMIDVSDLSQPTLKTSLAVSGTPRELYVLNDLYVLLSQTSDYQNSELRVVKQQSDGTLAVVDTQAIPGYFYESRRRNDRIYSVASVNMADSYADLDINVVQIDALGHLDSIDNARIRGYSPKIAIFPDYLAIANDDPNTYPDSLVQVFALNDASQPLVNLGAVRVSGYVPSEFHIDVYAQQLRVVYGPKDRSTGSSLGIYDLSQTGLPLLGEVKNIAPGESLFATRFYADKAYVVTFLRKDPLWVIGLSDPTKPTILGELQVPGWSEKLFFNDNRLFAVGIDDQAGTGEAEGWYSRVAMSLFDVSDPLKPSLLDRVTPLTGVVNYSYSPALNDERALLLNWDRNFAAMPIDHWYPNLGNMNHLQMLDFSQDKFLNLGLLELTVPAQRSLLLGNDHIGVMADQRFITAQWSATDKPKVLGELELARNLGWLDGQADKLWSAGYGQNGYRYVYRYTADNVELPAQSWTLAQDLYQVANTDTQALFYQQNPMAVQRFDYATQSLSALQIIEPQAAPDANLVATDSKFAPYNQRSELLIDEAGFYLGEQRQVSFEVPQPMPLAANGTPADTFNKPDVYNRSAWQLRTWQWHNGKAIEQTRRAIPGKPLALTQDGRLITVERTSKGSRLEVVALRGIWAQVVQLLDLDCNINVLHTQADGFYGTCTTDTYYYPTVNTLADTPATSDTSFAPIPTQTRLLHLVLDAQLHIAQEWKLDGQRELLAIQQGVVMLGPNYSYPIYSLGKPAIAVDAALASPSIMPSPNSSSCEVFALRNDLQSLAKLDTCPTAQHVVLYPKKAYITKGFAGIQQIAW